MPGNAEGKKSHSNFIRETNPEGRNLNHGRKSLGVANEEKEKAHGKRLPRTKNTGAQASLFKIKKSKKKFRKRCVKRRPAVGRGRKKDLAASGPKRSI